jgi:crossover junction endodeoxyribonuclease RuvC
MSIKDKVKIVSLDVSSTCTGYSSFSIDLINRSFEHIETGSISSSKKNIYSRFAVIHGKFLELDLYTDFDIVVFENYAFNGNRVTQLAELNGLLKYNYYLNGVPIEVIAPNTVKKIVTDNGHAKKDVVRKSIQEKEEFKNVKIKNNDESDSLAVGYAYIIKTLREIVSDGK